MFFVPDDAEPFFLQEMVKLARRAADSDAHKTHLSLELKDNPRSFGIRAKKTGQDDRGLAYTQGIGRAAAAGAGLGAAVGAVTGRKSQLSLFREGEAKKAVQEALQDGLTLQKAVDRAGIKGVGVGGVDFARRVASTAPPKDAADAARGAMRGPPGVQAKAQQSAAEGAQAAADELMSPAVRRILKRRGKAALGAAGLAALGGATLKTGLNAAQYESARALSTGHNREKVQVK